MANEQEVKEFYREVQEMKQLSDEINAALERLEGLRAAIGSKHQRMRELNSRWLDKWDGRLDEMRDELRERDLL